MRRRPLALLCLAIVLVISLAGRVYGARKAAALADLEGYLTKAEKAVTAMTLTCIVADVRAESEGVSLSVDHIQIDTKDKSKEFLSSEIKFILTTEEGRYLPGDLIRVTGAFYPFSEASNPGEFDARQYYFSMDTVGRITDPAVTLLEEGGRSFKRMLARLRRALLQSYFRILDEKTAKIIAAISLGEKSLMEHEWKMLYQEGGIAHTISVSGLHISLIGMCLYELLRRLRLPFAAAALISGAMVTGYALMTGFGVSAVRAALMFLIWLGAQILGRKRDMLTAVALAAVLILAQDARKIESSSFLLSFGAVLAIALLVPHLAAANPFRISPDPHPDAGLRSRKARRIAEHLWNTLCQSAGIWLGTLPVTLLFFYQSAPWSMLVNLAVIPLMSAVMASAFLSCLAGLISVSAGTFLAAPVYYLLRLFESLCLAEQQLPGALWVAGCPGWWRIVFYYALFAAAAFPAAAVCRRRACADGGHRNILPMLLWACAILGGLCLMGIRPRSSLTVTDLDVGQGDGALLEFADGRNCLIDGGSSSVNGVWEYRISRTLKYKGIDTLDYIFLSHADSDHINGVEEYLEAYQPGFAGKNAHGISLRALVLPPAADPGDFSELTARARELEIPVLRMSAGASVGTDAWSLACLAPDGALLSGEKNEDSMVLMLQYKEFRMLFTGDLENEAEIRLAASGADLSCDVLKVGHHGSKNSSSEEFLAAAAPTVGILSCAARNRYGHPAPEAVARLMDAGVKLFATKDCGAVQIRTDGSRYTIRGYKEKK